MENFRMNTELINLITEIYLRSYFLNKQNPAIPVMTMQECKDLAVQMLTSISQL